MSSRILIGGKEKDIIMFQDEKDTDFIRIDGKKAVFIGKVVNEVKKETAELKAIVKELTIMIAKKNGTWVEPEKQKIGFSSGCCREDVAQKPPTDEELFAKAYLASLDKGTNNEYLIV